MSGKHSTRCTVPNCSSRAIRIVGECRYCENKFCGQHRIPETHACPNLITCKQNSFRIYADRLLSEKCVASKV
ncbi:AN1 zinc finger protein [Basidiobolus meristosporus CBS 931.73]|uniref:AN1 zinc finger protein n=1 Tax=Basidiobolus meristosporus CBS 931.73 TaxID=1314790 RepID=A0A1Y1Y7R8_9FUNG|nr:AN1 zinc finger protein [Basidiobolus meristosporus CBS 931.73]|eukprot:ORX93624.1 AN1 zinc finger protein [Basidiobolus meristosporus CBS 931.73]